MALMSDATKAEDYDGGIIMGRKLAKAKDAGERFATRVQGRAGEVGGEVVKRAKFGIGQAQKVAEDTAYDLRMKKYSPFFSEEYFSEDYSLPQMIVIEDGDDRKGIDVCEGAVGWTSREAKLNVLHLYASFVEDSGLVFYPAAALDSIYMMDTMKSSRFVDLSKYFRVVEDEKIAELLEVGHALGAKKCTVETYETAMEVSLKRGKAQAKAKGAIGGRVVNAQCDVNASIEQSKNRERKTVNVQEWDGSDISHRPALYWFRDDAALNNLIESFCGDYNANKPKTVHREVESSSTEMLSGIAASQVEAALKKMGAQFNFLFEGEVKRESRQTLMLHIEF